MNKRKILIAEDNTEISDMMRNYLLKAEYSVYQAYDGLQAIEMASSVRPDLMLLDIMMPVCDGFEVCESVRKNMNIPIIVISAVVDEESKLKLFELGADDYLTKPFSFKEMVMRVAAQLRRFYEFTSVAAKFRTYGRLTISSDRFEAKVDGEEIGLTSTEFRLLDFLTSNPNRIFSKQKLIDEVWGIDEYIDENTVAVTVSRLRDKLEKLGVSGIATVWGFGYKWQD
ncbi:MAG: response regulator transcription factor [Clostridia bacterium]|nr:response regulator transcription factor [Clostridia bacterium]MCI8729523.1 response regulator transcription factor [Clostridia bacterium]